MDPSEESLELPQLGKDGRILEGILTTLNHDGSVNISPMGAIVDERVEAFVLRPFRTSTTYQNLKRTGRGVFHVTDDVELFAQAALGQPDPLPALDGLVLTDACRWYAFELQSLDDSQERTAVVAHTVDRGRNRDFFGFNRAKHAVLEAAILATRVHFVSAEELTAELDRLASPIEKTAGDAELRAFQFLRTSIEQIVQSIRVSDNLAPRPEVGS